MSLTDKLNRLISEVRAAKAGDKKMSKYALDADQYEKLAGKLTFKHSQDSNGLVMVKVYSPFLYTGPEAKLMEPSKAFIKELWNNAIRKGLLPKSSVPTFSETSLTMFINNALLKKIDADAVQMDVIEELANKLVHQLQMYKGKPSATLVKTAEAFKAAYKPYDIDSWEPVRIALGKRALSALDTLTSGEKYVDPDPICHVIFGTFRKNVNRARSNIRNQAGYTVAAALEKVAPTFCKTTAKSIRDVAKAKAAKAKK